MGPENDALAKCNSGKHMAIWGIHVKFLGCRCDSSLKILGVFGIENSNSNQSRIKSVQDLWISKQ